MKKQSAISVILAALLLSSALAACGENETQVMTDEDTAAPVTEETEAPAETQTMYSDTLEAQDFGGIDFRIYENNSLVGMTLPTTINYAAEESGEIVNDTLYAREQWIEETYHVNVVNIDGLGDTWAERKPLSSVVLAGEDAYDLVLTDASNNGAFYFSINGYSYPLTYIDSIHLDKPYWMPEVNEKLKVNGELYVSACPISPRYYGSVYIIQFNRDLAKNLDLDDFYDLVNEGKWTIDRMFDAAKDAYADLNGDGKMDENDQYGLVYEVLTPESIILGAGMHYVENDNGTFKVMLDDENLVDLINKIAEFAARPCCARDASGFTNGEVLLNNGTYLFRNPCTFDLAAYRDLQYDYGVLPMPKLDEAQTSYIGYSQPWATNCPVVLTSVPQEHLGYVGTIIDAMTAYGYDYVKPAVFDNVIQLKGARDEKSASIIDKMFENITFEYMCIGEFNGLADAMHRFFMNDLGKRDVASTYAALKPKTETFIEDMIAQYQKNAENRG